VNGQWLIESRNHVHPSGQFVYIGNRAAPAGGRNEIAVFRSRNDRRALACRFDEAVARRSRVFRVGTHGTLTFVQRDDVAVARKPLGGWESSRLHRFFAR
jgi:6-phosphogluconolactonase (cycloisomerase 2 family)